MEHQTMNVRLIIVACLLAARAPCAAHAAIAFDSGDYLSWSTAPVSQTPLTIYCRFSVDSNSDGPDTYVSIAENGNHADGSFTIGDDGFAHFRAYAAESNSFSIAALASPTVSTATWHHGFGRFVSSTSRYAEFNGNEIQNTPSRTPAGLNSVRIGATDPIPHELAGQMSEVCIWNIDLSGAERASIRDGARPCAVQPSAVVFYFSGLTTTAEIGGSATETGSPIVVTHPPVVYVTRPMVHARRR
jgi:Concanavalin A-like lectin/glucanases superfamily